MSSRTVLSLSLFLCVETEFVIHTFCPEDIFHLFPPRTDTGIMMRQNSSRTLFSLSRNGHQESNERNVITFSDKKSCQRRENKVLEYIERRSFDRYGKHKGPNLIKKFFWCPNGSITTRWMSLFPILLFSLSIEEWINFLSRVLSLFWFCSEWGNNSFLLSFHRISSLRSLKGKNSFEKIKYFFLPGFKTNNRTEQNQIRKNPFSRVLSSFQSLQFIVSTLSD